MSFVAAAVVGASVVGGVISSSATSGAANKAAKVSSDTTASNNALARDIYGQNTQTLAPFVQQGGAATSYINQLLGIQTAPTAGTVSAPGAYNPGGAYNGGIVGNTRPEYAGTVGYGIASDLAFNGQGRDPNNAGGYYDRLVAAGGGQQPQGAVQGNQQLAPGSASNAFDAYRNSTGYQFRLGEGNRAITNNKAVSGLLNSGSALKDLTRFGQDFASNEFGNYLGQLTGQQGVGLSAASAQAGVANNFSAQVQGNNSTNATNQGNAAIAKANGTVNAVQGVLGTAGYLAGMKM